MISDFVDTIRDDGIRGKMMQATRVIFFAGLLLGLSGMVFGQEADATVWIDTEILFEIPKEEVALVTVTVISSETETYDPPIDKIEYTLTNRVTTTFSIDEIIYGNERFPLKSASISKINSDAKKVGDRYVVGYHLFTEGWGVAASSPLEPMSYGEFAAFYEDLLTNPCGIGMHYLVKNSDLEKICVRHDTRDRLIERGVGFFVPSLTFHEWKRISGDPPRDAGSDAYDTNRNRPHCNSAVLSRTGDYCVPYWIKLSFGTRQHYVSGEQPFNFKGDAVSATLATDKLHYAYGEQVRITGQFSDYVGEWLAFDSKLVPIDSENRFSTHVDLTGNRWLTAPEAHLVLHYRYYGEVEQINLTMHPSWEAIIILAPEMVAQRQINLTQPGWVAGSGLSAFVFSSYEIAENTAGTLTALSIDSDRDLQYWWDQTRGPDAALTDRGTPIARFTAPEVTEDTYIEFSLTVVDGYSWRTSEVRLTVTDSPDAPAQ